jgi:hypothetical protein
MSACCPLLKRTTSGQQADIKRTTSGQQPKRIYPSPLLCAFYGLGFSSLFFGLLCVEKLFSKCAIFAIFYVFLQSDWIIIFE